MTISITTGDQKIYINDCGPAVCCFVYSILTSYCESDTERSFLSRERPIPCSDTLFNNLNARCYLFCAHFRKLCFMCRIPNDNQSNLGLLLPKKQSTKIVSNDSCIEEPVTNSDDDDHLDRFYHFDSEDEDDQKQKAARELENSHYILKAGTLITFIPQTIFGNECSITCQIDTIKDDCNTAQYPLVVQGGRLTIDKDVFMRVEGKTHPFRFGSVILQPGTVVNHTKKIKKLPTFEEHLQQFNEMMNKEELGKQCGNSKKPFIVPKQTKITF